MKEHPVSQYNLKIDFNIPVPMRDGTILRANIIQPLERGKYPVALCRTPYNKDLWSVTPLLDAYRLARTGYIVVIQDVRGRYASEGEWSPFEHEGLDGYDSVLWSAELPHSSGVVGMFGASYVGFTQWITAVHSPKPLKAIVPSVTWADAADGFSWRGGAFELGVMALWLMQTGVDLLARRGGDVDAVRQLIAQLDALPTRNYRTFVAEKFDLLQQLCIWNSLAERLSQGEAPAYMSPFADETAYDRVSAATLNVAGWYDVFLQGSLNNFTQMAKRQGTQRHHLLVGPWSHSFLEPGIGEVDFGAGSSVLSIDLREDLTQITQRWFDFWLKGIDNGIADEPPVRLFVMGSNSWRNEQEWPLKRAVATPYYLCANGNLSTETPNVNDAPKTFCFEPKDPTPTLGGHLVMQSVYGTGVKDQRPIESRSDVLSYTSAILETELEITGEILAHIWMTSEALSTDVVVRLVDAYPDGFSHNLADGIQRVVIEQNAPQEVIVRMWSTSHVIQVGHRLRVHVASASFPRWDVNPTLERAPQPVTQIVFQDNTYPSHILLPIVSASPKQ
jgi:uncharacterized protein